MTQHDDEHGAPEKVNREGWAAGPWDVEPDRLEWRDAATGMPCLIVRNHLGSLCGYVGVPPGHPFHGIDYAGCALAWACNDAKGERSWDCKHRPEALVDVHGGLTYADRCNAPSGICHVAKPDEPDDVWWLGFDCAHGGDVTPAMDAMRAALGKIKLPGLKVPTALTSGSPFDEVWKPTYKDVDYVKGECAQLAAQLADVDTLRKKLDELAPPRRLINLT